MRALRTLFCLLLVCVLSPCIASAQGFEGTFHQRIRMLTPAELPQLRADAADAAAMLALLELPVEDVLATPTGMAPEISFTVHIKGRRIRLDMELPGMPMVGAAGMYTIIDAERDEMSYVVTPMRQVMRISLSETQRVQQEAARRHLPEGVDTLAEPQIRELGDSTVHGMPVRIYEVVAHGVSMRIWATPQHADLARAMEALQAGMPGAPSVPGGRSLSPAALGLSDIGLPVRAQMVMQAPESMRAMAGPGLLYTITEVSDIRSRPVPDETFEVPSDYSVVPMPAGMMMQP